MKIGKRTVILVRDLEAFLQDGQPSFETLEQAIKAEQELSKARRRLLVGNESMMGLDN